MELVIQELSFGKIAVCESILRSLPEWFGIEEAITHYVESIKKLPTLIAVKQMQTVGFLTLKQYNQFSAKIYVMGVVPQMHRQGVGRGLVRASESCLKNGTEYLQVKTIGSSHTSKYYLSTRSFYHNLGFRPIEEFTQIWGEENPCLLMVKALQ
ncbi:MAG: GNAT family N-acetyltransferase [Cyanobacteria bacterium P01_A01_bin.45]